LGHSTFAAHFFETPYLSIAVENLPTVGTFSHEYENQIVGDEETQNKVNSEPEIADIVLPEHVNVLQNDTLENTDFPEEITDGL